jgi:1D-myo-inositol-tetrakisphosphate 5-kinase/inositol-polyphosphate multikinase
LQNLSNDFTRPNILDIKLGIQLYDEDATPEKKERMIQAAKETTSLETGVRMTGFQVCRRNNAISTRLLDLIASPILV